MFSLIILVRKEQKVARGHYGEVRLVEHIPTHTFYLWRKMKLSHVTYKGRICQSLEELPSFHTPFLVNHPAIINDQDSCYLLMERCDYGSFSRLLHTRKNPFNDKA